MTQEEIGCICAEWDGRGRSCCGVECLVHPLNGNCPGCGKATHAAQLCFLCHVEDVAKRKPKEVKDMEALLYHVTECLYAFRGRVDFPDKNIELAQEAQYFAELRRRVIVWLTDVRERSNWYE